MQDRQDIWTWDEMTTQWGGIKINLLSLKFINKTTYNKKEIRIQFKIVLHQGNFTDYNLRDITPE
jgi:hypothetical protein